MFHFVSPRADTIPADGNVKSLLFDQDLEKPRTRRCRGILHVIHGYMQKIQILFPDPIMARLRRLAKIQDRPVSEIVRRAVEETLAKSPEPSGTKRQIPSFRGGKMLCSAAELRDRLYREDVP
jgi:hypothetical protein